MKVGLYSITCLGVWYDGPALTFSEFVKRAKAYGYAGIELDGKRPHGNPMDLDQRARDEMRNVMERERVEMVCVATNNDFSSPLPEHRECQLLLNQAHEPLGLAYVDEQVQLAQEYMNTLIQENA